MNKDTMKPAYVAGETKLFDNWFDAIEDGVRGRVRGFIETMLEEELDGALSRPRYGRRKPDEGDNEPGVAGHRHGHRRRTLTGTFGKTEIDVPRARLACADGKTGEWKSKGLRAYQRRTKASEGDATARKLLRKALDARKELRSTMNETPEAPMVVHILAKGSPNGAVRSLEMAVMHDAFRPTARYLLEPWLVESALQRLGERRFTREEQIKIVKSTRTPKKVKWPDWWEERP